jgi:hypothetical protein
MARPWLRLVAYVSLAAFLAANGPFAFRACLASAGGCHCPNLAQRGADPAEKHTHRSCQPYRDRGLDEAMDERRLQTTDHHEELADRDCPCHGSNTPCQESGGCTYCNVAKTLSCVGLPSIPLTETGPSQGIEELTFSLPAQHVARLIRPPRA